MAKLPPQVLETLTVAEPVAVPREVPDEGNLISKVIHRIVSLLAKSAESTGEGADESTDGDDKGEVQSCDELTYGYPPAYGVPAQVAVKLLSDALSVLRKVSSAVEDNDLNMQVNEVISRIEEALGIGAKVAAKPNKSPVVDWLAELQLAVTVSQGTQPVLSPVEAAEKLRSAWEQFATTVKLGYSAEQGKPFDAVFALRAAVDSAQRTLLSVSQASASETSTETEVQKQTVNTETVENSAQDEVVAEANKPAIDNAVENEPATEQTNDSQLAEVVMMLASQVNEVLKRLDQVESLVANRKRVTLFAASKKDEKEDDLLHRWYNAKTDSERRAVLREAQHLLAAPIILNDNETD